MSTTTNEWKLMWTLPDEHRIFCSDRKRLAIADQSGETPDQTDDGVLLLDFSRPLIVTGFAGRERYFIPLKDAASPTTTISDVATLLFLSATFQWPIKVSRQDSCVDSFYDVTG